MLVGFPQKSFYFFSPSQSKFTRLQIKRSSFSVELLRNVIRCKHLASLFHNIAYWIDGLVRSREIKRFYIYIAVKFPLLFHAACMDQTRNDRFTVCSIFLIAQNFSSVNKVFVLGNLHSTSPIQWFPIEPYELGRCCSLLEI